MSIPKKNRDKPPVNTSGITQFMASPSPPPQRLPALNATQTMKASVPNMDMVYTANAKASGHVKNSRCMSFTDSSLPPQRPLALNSASSSPI